MPAFNHGIPSGTDWSAAHSKAHAPMSTPAPRAPTSKMAAGDPMCENFVLWTLPIQIFWRCVGYWFAFSRSRTSGLCFDLTRGDKNHHRDTCWGSRDSTTARGCPFRVQAFLQARFRRPKTSLFHLDGETKRGVPPGNRPMQTDRRSRGRRRCARVVSQSPASDAEIDAIPSSGITGRSIT